MKNRPLLQQLKDAVKIIKIISRSRKIRLVAANFLALDKAVDVMRDFFSEKCPNGYESKDRRFLLKQNGNIHYQADTKEIVLKLRKLLVTLSLNAAKLFDFLKGISKKDIGVSPYSSDEKAFIRIFLSSSGFSRRHIPCAKVRKLCT